MYFNLDNQKKEKILKYYKNQADEYRRHKEEAKKQRIKEELNYLHQREQKQQETDEKIFLENNRKKKALMDEYLEMLRKTKNYLPGYHFKPKNKEVIINNWGKTKEEFLKENNSNNDLYNINKYKNKSIDINSYNKFNSLNPIEKAKIIIRPIDSMNKFLTDEQNEKEVNSFFMRQKQNKQNFYKDLLYSQYKNNILKNKNIFGTEDILILKEKKKKLITENPYKRKNEYGFGDSNLENNPILNPENNIRYNKYFKDFYSDNNDNINNINNSNNSNINIEIIDDCNNNYNDYKYNNENKDIYKNNYINQKNGINLANNGSNIMNTYKINIPKYKINNALSRNFSDIYSNYKTINNNYNINNHININNEGNRHKLLNNSKRNFSQIQI